MIYMNHIAGAISATVAAFMFVSPILGVVGIIVTLGMCHKAYTQRKVD